MTPHELTQDQQDEQLRLAKIIDLARPLGLTEQRLVEELRHERLVESCEGTPICHIADRMGGDNYTK